MRVNTNMVYFEENLNTSGTVLDGIVWSVLTADFMFEAVIRPAP